MLKVQRKNPEIQNHARAGPGRASFNAFFTEANVQRTVVDGISRTCATENIFGASILCLCPRRLPNVQTYTICLYRGTGRKLGDMNVTQSSVNGASCVYSHSNT